MQNWSADHPFTSIGFNVRDEDKNKSIVLDVELESGKGITLRNGAGKPIQYVRLSNNDPTALGKLIHPTQVTLYKVRKKFFRFLQQFLNHFLCVLRSLPLHRRQA